MRCRRCEHGNPEGSRFCTRCGVALTTEALPETRRAPAVAQEPSGDPPNLHEPSFSDTHAEALGALSAGDALLVVQHGPNVASRFTLDQPVITVGRHPGSDIVLDDVTVSRRHAEFHREPGGYAVHDVGSLNGTYVNRKPVHVASLASGDTVQIGKFGLVFLTDPRTDDPLGRGDAR
ncbi:MAG TPA: FHA domain-containing protein [Blastococcus sp.]|nr:FHA domain-containing protein [Blastococcus sp.]